MKLNIYSRNEKFNKVLFFLVILFIGNIIHAQDFSFYKPIIKKNNRKAFLRLQSISFLKNNEYFNDFTSGFTGIGFTVKPTIEYYLNTDTKISVGYFFLKYSGLNKFSQNIPIFSVQHKLNQNLEMIFGNIFGTLHHELEEPLFRIDRYYQNNVEYGLQFILKTKGITNDFWVNWEKFIQKNDPFQEEFVAGNNANIILLNKKSWSLSLPFQLLFNHRGGQIDTSHKAVSTLMNGLGGFSLKYTINRRSICFKQLIMTYNGLNIPGQGEPNSQIFEKGYGYYSKIEYKQNSFQAMLGYWSANKFIAPRGEYLFQSISGKRRGAKIYLSVKKIYSKFKILFRYK